MVKIIKSLVAVLLFLSFNLNLFSQEISDNSSSGNNNTVVENNSVVSDSDSFENNTDYFAPSFTAETENKKSSGMAGVIIKIILFLALVVGAIYALMFFFKKKNNIVKSDDDFLRRVSSLSLSPGKSVEIITLIDKGYILGVTEGSINLIAEIEDKEMIQALNLNLDKKQSVKKPLNFGEILEMFTNKGNKTSNIYSEAEDRVNNMRNK
ncbi:MAG: FliO/MopB family protein [Treponema sp.]|nr:FliO/MopB family protein [Treponema sp.]